MKKSSSVFYYSGFIFALTLGVSHFGTASTQFTPLVNGGSEVAKGEAIGTSTIMLHTSTQYCTGTLISKKTILTAAHCLADQPDSVEILFKGLTTDDPGFRRPISSYRIHDEYRDVKDRDDRNDLAIVYFEGSLPSGYQPASLVQNFALPPGTPVWVAGFGYGSPLGTLKKLEMTIHHLSDGKTLAWLEQTTSRGVCHGDSGGPLFIVHQGQWLLAGVTSYAEEYDCSGHAVYTSLWPYLSWIQKNSL